MMFWEWKVPILFLLGPRNSKWNLQRIGMPILLAVDVHKNTSLKPQWIKPKFPGNWVWVWVRGRGCHFLKNGTWVHRGYNMCVCVCHSHIIHACRFLHKLWIMIHNYKFDDYLNEHLIIWTMNIQIEIWNIKFDKS